jgi:hypothetical protein
MIQKYLHVFVFGEGNPLAKTPEYMFLYDVPRLYAQRIYSIY